MTEQIIKHMLGYLKPEQWADALNYNKESDIWVDGIKKLIKEQEFQYSFQLMKEVKDILDN